MSLLTVVGKVKIGLIRTILTKKCKQEAVKKKIEKEKTVDA